MTDRVFRLPDIGEGIAEAELSAWRVGVGDLVAEDQIVAEVMTDKAVVEIPSPISGRVVWLACEEGSTLAIGDDLIRLEVKSDQAAADEPPGDSADRSATLDAGHEAGSKPDAAPPAATQPQTRGDRSRATAAPTVRQAARERGIDLGTITGSGPGGRIMHADLDRIDAAQRSASCERRTITDRRITGLRRRIAERMRQARTEAPHFSIVEEVDVTELEHLRTGLNADANDLPRLTMLPFIMRAIVVAVARLPAMNAHFLGNEELVREFGAVHLGIATQTEGGLMVPVLRHAEALDLRGLARGVQDLSTGARNGVLDRALLSGSTITVSSLGPLGAIATTPILNLPEVAIVGVNRVAIRPGWDGHAFVPRSMMNLSCSFDHRVIDGYDAAIFVQQLKTLLESPARLFIAGPA